MLSFLISTLFQNLNSIKQQQLTSLCGGPFFWNDPEKTLTEFKVYKHKMILVLVSDLLCKKKKLYTLYGLASTKDKTLQFIQINLQNNLERITMTLKN